MDLRYIHAFGSTAADDVAHIDILRSGRIICLDWTVAVDSETDAESCDLQLSFSAAGQTSNDAQNIISAVTVRTNLVTSGMQNNSINKVVSGISLAVRQGQRVYLHCTGISGITYYSRTVLHIM